MTVEVVYIYGSGSWETGAIRSARGELISRKPTSRPGIEDVTIRLTETAHYQFQGVCYAVRAGDVFNTEGKVIEPKS